MRKCILTVDDCIPLLKMLSAVLQFYGFSVIEAVDGNDALKKMVGHHVDLVITDMMMPIMDGIELSRAIRANPQYEQLPIIMSTSMTEENACLEASRAGVTGWLDKPFVPDQLLSVVTTALGCTAG